VSATSRKILAGVVAAVVGLALPGLRATADPAPRTPPPTPVDGRPSPFPTDLQTPVNPVRRPEVTAPGALLADLGTGVVLYRKATETARPIASVTKIMTAILVLERADLSDVVTVDPRAVYDDEDYGASATVGLRPGERITVGDLLYALLLASANDAAEALAIHIDGSEEAFVERMNRRAASLAMSDTRFFSSSGLDDRGRSTPSDLLRLVVATEERPIFRRIVATRFATISGPPGRPDRRIQNRNVLLWLYPGADGTKTGYTLAADGCLVATASRDGRRLAAIVLGAPGGAFSDAAALLNHGFEGFTRETFVTAGEDAGSVRIRGGTVPVVAAEDLVALVPILALEDVDREIVVDPAAAFPPAPGSEVAELRIRASGLGLGTVPLLVDAVPAAPAEEGPWWTRTVSTIAGALADAVAGLAD
jgi:D-alanyl-D-alanine carboxypeptidase (penicillin-binding protein 5/6)